MTADWSHGPLPPILNLTEIELVGESIGFGGESSGVRRLAAPHHDWVFKRYLNAVPSGPLGRLIAYPENLTPDQRAVIDRHTAWPVALVEERTGESIGVIMPVAPDAYWARMRLPSGKVQRHLLELDHLARDTTRQQNVGLQPQTLRDRLAVCASFTAVAALLEQIGLVYLDWSFANVLWSTHDRSAYIIDIDGASFGARRQIGTHMFDDPHVPMNAPAGVEVDRYRVALLVAWCITGRSPDRPRMLDDIHGLASSDGPARRVAQLISHTFDATSVTDRTPIHLLHQALRQSITSKVSEPFIIPREVVASGDRGRPVIGPTSQGYRPRPTTSPPLRAGPPTGSTAHGAGAGARPPVPSSAGHRTRGRSKAGLWLAAIVIALVLVVVGMRSETNSQANPTRPGPNKPGQTSVRRASPTPTALRVAPVAITVPDTAQNGTDDAGNSISYDEANLFDDDPTTCWRMNGNGAGQTITIDFGTPKTVVSVGLIPGYAKVDSASGVNRFTQNRRVVRVTWTSDDGRTTPQELADSPKMQVAPMSSVTRYLRLTIGAVTADGGRDFTAISEIKVTGYA